MDPKKVNIIQLNLAVLTWGITAMFAKGITLPIHHIIWGRALVASALLALILIVKKEKLFPSDRRDIGPLVVSGVIMAVHWLTYFYALRTAGAARGILALATYPVFTTLIEPFIFKTALRKSDILVALGTLAGVAVMTPAIGTGSTVDKGDIEVTLGILSGLVSGILFMTRNLISKKCQARYSSVFIMYWQVLVTWVVLLIILPVTIPLFNSSDPGGYGVRNIGFLVLLGVFFTALPHTLFTAGMRHVSARTAGIINNLLPFYGAFFGYLFHGETIGLRTAAGGLIVLCLVGFETVRSVSGSHVIK